MTRVRILIMARKILANGYVQYCATDAVGNPMTYAHPDTKNFSLTAAIQRAIYDTTGDDFNKRDTLFEATYDPLIKRVGGYSNMRNFLQTATQQQVIDLVDQQLSDWNMMS